MRRNETNRQAAERLATQGPPTTDPLGRPLSDRQVAVVTFAMLARGLVRAVLDIGDAIRETRGDDR